MVLEWKTVFTFVGIFTLCFLGIPIKIDKSPELKASNEHFEQFVTKFSRNYSEPSEYETRFLRFQESVTRAGEFNQSRIDPLSAVYGVTKFSDLSPEEFVQKHLSPDLPRHMKSNRRKHGHHRHNVHKRAAIDNLPLKVDWREKDVLTPVKNQLTCGACWAFSTVETIETMVALKTGQLRPLSVQESVDCATNGNIGCAGGDTCRVLEWMVQQNIELLPEEKYPFKGVTETCHLQKIKGGGGVRIASNYTCDDFVDAEEVLLATLAFHGPVAVAINALHWQNYLGGVIQFHCDGAPQSLNHAVQIVGYDRTASIPFYIVRNSWGTDFGDHGYLYIAIGHNVCGLANEVSAIDIL